MVLYQPQNGYCYNSDTHFLYSFICKSLEKYKNRYFEIQYELYKYNIEVKRKIKEYCFCDDNLKVDEPWLKTYNLI